MSVSFNKRYVANIVFEAKTPLKVGSSDIDMLQDAPIQKDWNALPMILGTSIAGVLRKEFDAKFANDIFGDEDSKKEDAKGSRLIISNALLVDDENKVNETLLLTKTPFLKIFDNLPIRDHTAITCKGVAKETSKYDEEIVYKGSRFKMRLELIANEKDEQNWLELFKVLNSKIFMLGGGSTKGFGDINILHQYSSYDIFDITEEAYQKKSSSLNTTYKKELPNEKSELTKYTTYLLKIKPDNFFMFGSGFGNDEVDMTPVYEQVVDYEKKKLSEERILIPVSSVKGALSHRTSYHFNKLQGHTIENGNGVNSIDILFGSAKESDEKLGSKGKVFFGDCFKEKREKTKIFDHITIDRYTNGNIEGEFFHEQTVADDGESYEIEMLLENSEFLNRLNLTKDEQIKEEEYKTAVNAFELALNDICEGCLPLGAATTKGHGVFSGNILKDGVPYEV